MQSNYINKIFLGDAYDVLKTFPDSFVDCVITSPPYWALRNYNVDGQLGLEDNYNDYINRLCDIFDECNRVLKKSGSCWVVIGDTYMGNSSYSKSGRAGFNNDKECNMKEYLQTKYPHKEVLRGREHVKECEIKSKSLCMIPSRFAIEMINRGWILRNKIIWHKPNVLPSPVKDRFTVDYEEIMFFTKNKKYYFEQQFEPLSEAIKNDKRLYNDKKGKSIKNDYNNGNVSGGVKTRQNILNNINKKGRNKRTVWSITTKGFNGEHYATFPHDLITPMINAGSPVGGIVLDPFMGSGTTALVSKNLGRKYIGIELNDNFYNIILKRLNDSYNMLDMIDNN